VEAGTAIAIERIVAGVGDDGEVASLGSGTGGWGHRGSVVVPSGDAAATRQV
jgi:hypothetical protein